MGRQEGQLEPNMGMTEEFLLYRLPEKALKELEEKNENEVTNMPRFLGKPTRGAEGV